MTRKLGAPCANNHFQVQHVLLAFQSLKEITKRASVEGRDLVRELNLPRRGLGQAVYGGDFYFLTQNDDEEPCLTYGNVAVQKLWCCNWKMLTAIKSKDTAPPEGQAERQQAMDRVDREGFIEHYYGTRINTAGKEFIIEDVTIWNIMDGNRKVGRAAFFMHVTPSVEPQG